MQTIYNDTHVEWHTGTAKKLFAGSDNMRRRQNMVDGLISEGSRGAGVTVKVRGMANKVNNKTFRQLFAPLLRKVDNPADFMAIINIEAGPKLRAAWRKAINNGIKYFAETQRS